MPQKVTRAKRSGRDQIRANRSNDTSTDTPPVTRQSASQHPAEPADIPPPAEPATPVAAPAPETSRAANADPPASEVVRLRFPALSCRGCAHRLLTRLRREGITASMDDGQLSLTGDVLRAVESIRAWGFAPETATVRLPLGGTVAAVDAGALDASLSRIAGVVSVDVDLLAARVDLELLPDLVDIESVRTAASRIGYPLGHPTTAPPVARGSAAPAVLSGVLALAATATLLAPQEWLGPVATIGVDLAGGALAVAAAVAGAARTVVAGVIRIMRRTLDPASLLAFAVLTALAAAAAHLLAGTSPAFSFLTAAFASATFAVCAQLLRKLRDRGEEGDTTSAGERLARIAARRVRFVLLGAAPAAACAALLAGRSPAESLDAAAFIFGTAAIPLHSAGASALRWMRAAMRRDRVQIRSGRTVERLASTKEVVLLDSIVESGPSRVSDSVLLNGVTRDHLLACAASAAAAGHSSALRAIAERAPGGHQGCRLVPADAPDAERHLALLSEEADSYTKARKSPFLVFENDRLLGLLAVERPTIDELPSVASELRGMSVIPAIVTELDAAPARAVADHAGVELVAAATAPGAVRTALKDVGAREHVTVVGSDPFAGREELFIALSQQPLADVQIDGSLDRVPPLLSRCRSAVRRMRANTRAATMVAVGVAAAGAAAAAFSISFAVPVLFAAIAACAFAFVRSTRTVSA